MGGADHTVIMRALSAVIREPFANAVVFIIIVYIITFFGSSPLLVFKDSRFSVSSS